MVRKPPTVRSTLAPGATESQVALANEPALETVREGEVSLSLKAVHKNGERWFDRRVTKIIQSGPAPRFGAKRVALQQP